MTLGILKLKHRSSAILRTKWQDLVDFCMDRYYNRTKTVNVRIYYNEEAYDAINYYVNLHTERLPGLVDAICMYEDSKPKADNQKSDEEEKPKVGFYPRKYSYPPVFPSFFSPILSLQASIPPMKLNTTVVSWLFVPVPTTMRSSTPTDPTISTSPWTCQPTIPSTPWKTFYKTGVMAITALKILG